MTLRFRIGFASAGLSLLSACGGASDTTDASTLNTSRGGSVGATDTEHSGGNNQSSSNGGATGVGGSVTTSGGSSVANTLTGSDGIAGSTTTGTSIGTGGTTSPPNVVVENGAPCSPVAARGCSSENSVAQMVCSSGNVWQWASDCATGTVCDPRPGMKVGQCIVPDALCSTPTRVFCDIAYGTLIICEAPGVVSKTEVCLSASCSDRSTCRNWDPCSYDISTDPGYYDCSGVCNGYFAAECLAPINAGKNGLRAVDNTVFAVAVPAASALPKIADCPNVHVFWVWLSKTSTGGNVYPLRLPEQYKAVIVSLAAVQSDAAGVTKLACNLPADYVSPTLFEPNKDQAVMIVTDDPNAPSFRLNLR